MFDWVFAFVSLSFALDAKFSAAAIDSTVPLLNQCFTIWVVGRREARKTF